MPTVTLPERTPVQQEYDRAHEDAIVRSIRAAMIAHPIQEKGWDKCMKTGKMPVKWFTKEQIREYVILFAVLADRYEELDCPLCAMFYRTGEGPEVKWPRDIWVKGFLAEHAGR